MKKAQLLSVVRHVLSVVAGLVLAYGIAEESLVSNVSAAVLGVISLVWSIKEKVATISQWSGVIRQVLTFVGAYLVGKGYLTAEKLEATIGGIIALLPVLLGQFDKIPQTPEEPKDPEA